MCVWIVKLHLASYYYAQTRVLKVQVAILAQHGKSMQGLYTHQIFKVALQLCCALQAR